MEKRQIEWELDELFSAIFRISLVTEPAHEVDELLMFNKTPELFKAINKEERIVTGVAMRPDIMIRKRDKDGEYEGFFSKETIKKAAQLFFKKGSNLNNTNIEHQFEVEGVYVFESWIVTDVQLDKTKALGFKDIKEGDWIVSMKVDNDNIWNDFLKTGIIQGFSVEIKAKEVEIMSRIESILKMDISVDEQWDLVLGTIKQ